MSMVILLLSTIYVPTVNGITITLGVVTAAYSNRTTDSTQLRYLFNARQSLEDVLSNNYTILDPPLPDNVTINIQHISSYSSPTGAFKATSQLISNYGAVGIIGPFSSDECIPVATLGGALEVPIFSPSASTSEVSDKTRYPYFLRGAKVDTSVTDPLWALFEFMQWKRVCYVGTNEAYGRGLLNALTTKALNTDMEIRGLLFTAVVNVNTTSYAQEAFRTLLAGGCKIFVLHCITSYGYYALKAADNLGILDNPDMALVGTADWPSNIQSSISTLAPKLRGVFGLAPLIPSGTAYPAYVSRFSQKYPVATYGATQVADVNWYDVTTMYIQAIASLFDRSEAITGWNILNELHSMSGFLGLTGTVDFDSNYDRVQAFDLINFKSTDASYNRLGVYNPKTGKFKSYPIFTSAAVLVFPGGASQIARDGISVLDGDSLSPKVDGSIIVLAFCIGGISTWCSLILVEQILYAAEKGQRWWMWAIACGVTQGGPGMWALHVIAMCALSWPAPVDVVYDGGRIIGALAIAVGCTTLSFQSALLGSRRNKYLMDKASSFVGSTQPATGQKAAAAIQRNSNGNTAVGGSSGTSAQNKYEQDKTHTASSGATSRTKKRRLIKQLSGDHSVLGQVIALPYRLNLWFFISGVLLSVATIGSHALVSYSLPDALGVTVDVTLSVIYFLIGCVLFTIASLMTFYFFPQANARWAAALVMHLVVFASHMVVNAGATFKYKVTSQDTDNAVNWWSTRDLIMAVAVSTALLCFVLLGINVVRMKLSRNALDLIVVRFKKELASTVAQVSAEKEATMIQKKEKEKLWRMLDTINMCRPLHRDHALATTLADYEAESTPLITAAHIPTGAPATPTAAAVTAAGGATRNGSIIEGKTATGFGMDDTELKQPKVRATSAMSIYSQLCSTIGISGPTPDAVMRDVKLENILRHPVTLEIFKDAMIKEHNAENLMLYLDIRRYKATTDAPLRSMLSREIFDTFISRGARYEVNISDTMRRHLEAKFAFRPGVLSPASEDYLPTPVDLFASIEDELMKLIQVNNMPRFCSSPSFNLCALILGHPQFRIKPIVAVGRGGNEASGHGGGSGLGSPGNAMPGGYSAHSTHHVPASGMYGHGNNSSLGNTNIITTPPTISTQLMSPSGNNNGTATMRVPRRDGGSRTTGNAATMALIRQSMSPKNTASVSPTAQVGSNHVTPFATTTSGGSGLLHHHTTANTMGSTTSVPSTPVGIGGSNLASASPLPGATAPSSVPGSTIPGTPKIFSPSSNHGADSDEADDGELSTNNMTKSMSGTPLMTATTAARSGSNANTTAAAAAAAALVASSRAIGGGGGELLPGTVPEDRLPPPSTTS